MKPRESLDNVAVGDFERDGYVILSERLDASLVKALRTAYMARFDEKRKRTRISPVPAKDVEKAVLGSGEGGNHDRNRWNMRLPSEMPFLDARVISNGSIIPLVRHFLGEDCFLEMIASDMNMPLSSNQHIHRDTPYFSIVVNIPLVDVTLENGPLEIWPGSHVAQGEAFHTRPVTDVPQPPSTKNPGKRVTIPAGSLIVRDQRAYHRGTPNRSEEPRPVLTLLYAPNSAVPAAPYLWISKMAEGATRRVRRWALRGAGTSPIKKRFLIFGAFWGRLIVFTAKTDRLNGRGIPADLWRSLPPEARALLRFAEVKNSGRSAKISTSGASLKFLKAVLRGIYVETRILAPLLLPTTKAKGVV